MKTSHTLFGLMFLLSLNPLFAQSAPPTTTDVLKSLCDKVEPSQFWKKTGKTVDVCSVCPEFTSFKGEKQELSVKGIYAGDFLGAAKEEVLVILYGCEPHVAGFGGMALLRHEKSEWKRILYGTSIPYSQCIPFTRSSKLTGLLCLGSDMHFGAGGYFLDQISIDGNEIKNASVDLDGAKMNLNNASGSPQNGYCYRIAPAEMKVTGTQEHPRVSFQLSAGIEKAAKGSKEFPCSADGCQCENEEINGTTYSIGLQLANDIWVPTSASKKNLLEIKKINKLVEVKQ